MLEYSSVLNVGVKKGIINGFWSFSSVSEKSGGATAPPAPAVSMPMHKCNIILNIHQDER